MEYEVSESDPTMHRIFDSELEDDDEEPEYTPTSLPAVYDNDGDILIAFATGNVPQGLLAQKVYIIEQYN